MKKCPYCKNHVITRTNMKTYTTTYICHSCKKEMDFNGEIQDKTYKLSREIHIIKGLKGK